MSNRKTARRRSLRFLILVAVALVIITTALSGWVEKWLWMRQLDYEEIFWTILSIKWEMFVFPFAATFLYLWFNLRIAAANCSALGSADRAKMPVIITQDGTTISGIVLKTVLAGLSMLVALFFGLVLTSQWDSWIRFRFGRSFGLKDPLFGTDVGFYVFRLPFCELVQNSLTALTVLTLLMVAIAYGYFGLVQVSRHKQMAMQARPLSHLSTLLFFVAASWGWGFYIDHFELLYSKIGVVQGAGYTADHVTRIALWVMVAASAGMCVLLAFNWVRTRLKTLIAGAITYAAIYLIGVLLLPVLIQKLVVQPSELELETPYLRNNIEFTRKAYGLDSIRGTAYPALSDLTADAIARNQNTIQNIRLWDWRPLLQTYRQTQEIRLYYQFYGVDVDRYHLTDGYHQVMLSARELSAQLPEKAQTWVNRRLQFTHGYGLVMSFVSKIIGGGFPEYLIENIPPDSAYGLTVSQPRIYYGESVPGYRIVATGVKEFDYPRGDQNVYTGYQGKGGIPIDSLWKRLLFAWTQSDVNILLTSYLEPGSRIQLWRGVQERVGKIAPFLGLDGDPYAVLSEGKLYWIQDAYTVSDRYPYSTPHSSGFQENLNYIRNSVKVVVDMYDGTVRFYAMDPDDPVLTAYRRAFPGVFHNLGEMSQELRSHLRYPEDLFLIQADLYKSYHMTVPQVFYNQEDLWVSPQEKYAGTTLPMQPYYVLMKLPGNEGLEYLLMSPFTPQNRDNMIAWMAARCDFPEYGKLLVYTLPKEKLVLGPIQIEAMIDQNATISQQLSLWDQKGSKVIRGNLIVIPIDKSFLYVEPVYLTAEAANIPQLIRVIVVSGDKVVMEPTLDEAIKAVFGLQQPQANSQPAAVAASPEWERVRTLFEEAQKAMQQGDWKTFGQAMGALKELLATQKR